MSLYPSSNGVEEINYNGALSGIKLNGARIEKSDVTPKILEPLSGTIILGNPSSQLSMCMTPF